MIPRREMEALCTKQARLMSCDCSLDLLHYRQTLNKEWRPKREKMIDSFLGGAQHVVRLKFLCVTCTGQNVGLSILVPGGKKVNFYV